MQTNKHHRIRAVSQCPRVDQSRQMLFLADDIYQLSNVGRIDDELFYHPPSLFRCLNVTQILNSTLFSANEVKKSMGTEVERVD
jgi:hypothetical protein